LNAAASLPGLAGSIGDPEKMAAAAPFDGSASSAAFGSLLDSAQAERDAPKHSQPAKNSHGFRFIIARFDMIFSSSSFLQFRRVRLHDHRTNAGRLQEPPRTKIRPLHIVLIG
jgi:hypothetical protein